MRKKTKPTIKTTCIRNEYTYYDGTKVERNIYRVRNRICCTMETFSDKYRVAVGKPSDASVLAFNYPKTDEGLNKAQEKVRTICESTVTWYKKILNN